MKILGIDSSGLVAGVAVVEDDIVLGEYTLNYKKTHSQTLLPMLDELREMIELDLQTIDAIAIAAGPGSFTGLRIGAATAKGLGLALNKPLVEVPTLEGLAYNVYGTDRVVCPLMDARRNQVYTGIYRFVPEGTGFTLVDLMPQSAMDIREVIARLNEMQRDVIFLGDGVPVYREILEQELQVNYAYASPANNRQRAASVAALGSVLFAQGQTVSAADHRPEYLRKSQAEREQEEKLAAAEAEAARRELFIRPLEATDIAELLPMEQKAFSQPWSEESFRSLLTKDCALYLVACMGSRVVGICGMLKLGDEGDIDKVLVEESCRGQGIAGAMLQELLRRGEADGIQDFTLEVRVSNVPAIRLYERAGFVSEGIRPGFYEKPTEDAMILWRRGKN